MRANPWGALALLSLFVVACGESPTPPESERPERGEPLRAQASTLCAGNTGLECGANGVLGAYYDREDYLGLKTVRLDSNVAFAWQGGRPDPRVNQDTFAIRWAGFLEVPSTGRWRFWTYSDDRMEVRLNGATVVNDYDAPHGGRWRAGAWQDLEAGEAYAFMARMREGHGWATAQVAWQQEGGPRVTIPSSAFSVVPPSGSVRVEWFASGDAMADGEDPVRVTSAPSLDIDFTSTRPSGVPTNFAARVTGRIVALHPAETSLRLRGNGGAYLRVAAGAGVTLDARTSTGAFEETLGVSLDTGVPLAFALEVTPAQSGNTTVELEWSNPTLGDGSSYYPVASGVLSEAQIGRGDGLEGRYYARYDWSNLVTTRNDASIDFAWGNRAPDLGAGVTYPSQNFSVEWNARLEPPTTGTYGFHLLARYFAEVWIADQWSPRTPPDVCSEDIDCGWDGRCESGMCSDPTYRRILARTNGTSDASVNLDAANTYPVRIRYRDYGDAQVRLEWSSPDVGRGPVPEFQWHRPDRGGDAGEGLEGHYMPFRMLSPPLANFDHRHSPATLVRTDPEVNFNWGGGSPASAFPRNNFTAVWVGQIRPRYSETYTFRSWTDDSVVLYIDGQEVLRRWPSHASWREGTITLQAGKRYDIVYAMAEGGGGAGARLFWRSASQEQEIVPTSRLYPPAAVDDGTGLLAEYFVDVDLTEGGRRVLRHEPEIDASYSGSPAEGITAAGHAIRWSGRIKGRFTEPYTFTVRTNGGVRVWIDGRVVIDDWADRGDATRELVGYASLQAGRELPIVVEYVQNDETGAVSLSWESRSEIASLVPTSQLYPADPSSSVSFGQCRDVLSIDRFDDGSGMPDGLLDDGGMQLESSVVTQPNLWAANTNARSVTRLDTETGAVLGTYPTGWHPSRTAVDLDNNMWVADRAFNRPGTVTKVLTTHSDGTPCECCTSVNDDGECEYHPLDSCGECVAYTINTGHNTVPRALAIDANNDAWVGLWNTREAVHIRNCDVDPDTGVIDYECANPRCEAGNSQCISRAQALGRDCSSVPSDSCRGDQIVGRYRLPVHPYGFAIDREGKIWISQIGYGFGCFDTQTLQSCGRFRALNSATCSSGYGISLDGDGNVWTGNWSCGGLKYLDRGVYEDAITMFTTNGVTNWSQVENHVSRNGTYTFQHPHAIGTRGTAVDLLGRVWVTDSRTNRILQFDPSAPAPPGQCNTTGTFCPEGDWVGSYPTCRGPIGVGISEQGHAWAVCRSDNQGIGYDHEGVARVTGPTGAAPYSYSDMTGFQLRNFTAPQGQWRRVFDCDEAGGERDENGNCRFDYISWSETRPDGTRVSVRVRVGDDEGGSITWGPWSTAYEVTPAPLPTEGMSGEYVEVEITLFASERGATPIVHGLNLWRCPQMLPPQNLALDERLGQGNDMGIRWSFTDMSWPESYFELSDENGFVRCTLLSETSMQTEMDYASGDPQPGCTEMGHLSNTPLTRIARAVWVDEAGQRTTSGGSGAVTRYTFVNAPSLAAGDLRIMGRTRTSITVNWCKPQRNWNAGLTGARVERSADGDFTPNRPGYALLGDFPDGPSAGPDARGYAASNTICGNVVDAGLESGEDYYYRLTFQNGDGIQSASVVQVGETLGRTCCADLGTCEGECAGAEIVMGAGGEVCQTPPSYEPTEETCDGLDNDCDGEIDEGLLNACGLCGPTPVEVCDNVDNDCDGVVDDDPADGEWFYPDLDRDTFGNDRAAVFACAAPPNHLRRGGDCDDGDPAINPDAEEICNGIDDDCDGDVDEGSEGDTFYADADGDGFGDAADAVNACTLPDGYVENDDDCDDSDAAIHPDALEACDTLDNDCDGATDEGFALYAVEVTAVGTVADVGAAACTNDYSGPTCSGAAAVTVRVDNTGDTALPSSTEIEIAIDVDEREVLVPWEDLASGIEAGGSETFVYCFFHDHVIDEDDEYPVSARLAVPGDVGCGLDEDAFDDRFEWPTGTEICDGLDNDCDEETDENPEACGVTRLCVQDERNPGSYLCAAAQTVADIDCRDVPCPPDARCEGGVCVERCIGDEDCESGACVAGTCIDASWELPELPATEDVVAPDTALDLAPDATPSGPAQPVAPAREGCGVAASPASLWLVAFLGLALRRRRRSGSGSGAAA